MTGKQIVIADIDAHVDIVGETSSQSIHLHLQCSSYYMQHAIDDNLTNVLLSVLNNLFDKVNESISQPMCDAIYVVMMMMLFIKNRKKERIHIQFNYTVCCME